MYGNHEKMIHLWRDHERNGFLHRKKKAKEQCRYGHNIKIISLNGPKIVSKSF